MRNEQVPTRTADPRCIVVYDRDGNLRYLNGAAKALLADNNDSAHLRVLLDDIRGRLTSTDRLGSAPDGTCHIAFQLSSGVEALVQILTDGEGSSDGWLVSLDRGNRLPYDEDLYAATRFRGLETLCAGAAHDLRGPLNNMVVHLELLKHELRKAPSGDGGADFMQRIESVQREIHELNRNVQTLLDLTTTDDRRTPVDLTRVLGELGRLLRAKAKLQRVSVELSLPTEPVFVGGPRDRVRQIFLNIAVNALDAMPEGGDLHIRLLTDAGDSVLVELSNNGEPVPAASRDYIFQQRVTSRPRAAGIGLYVGRRLVEQLGGSIAWDGHANGDTHFYVRLPRCPAERDATP